MGETTGEDDLDGAFGSAFLAVTGFGGGTDGAGVRARSEARLGAAGTGSLRCPELRMGCGSAGRLVRSLRRSGRRAYEAVCVCLAQHGERSGLPLRVHERDAAGFPGSSRTGLSLVWWGLSADPVRQSERCSKEDPARTTARRDGPLHCLPLALAVRGRVLHAGGSSREGWDRVGGRLFPAEPLGAGTASRRLD